MRCRNSGSGTSTDARRPTPHLWSVPLQQPCERLIVKGPAYAAAAQPGLDGHPVPFILPAALERDLLVVCLDALRKVFGYRCKAVGHLAPRFAPLPSRRFRLGARRVPSASFGTGS